ncbi:MAG: protein-glutamate methylesterase/protein-glutamine glutaminase [Phycisphaerae bacterium]
MPNRPIKVLVVDDSIFMRTVLKGAMERADEIEVIGSAANGLEAVRRIKELKPQVVTLDIEMPGLDGLGVLEQVMKENPLPIVMVSTKTQEGAEMTFKALELGAVDYVAKPLAKKDSSLQQFQQDVITAIKTAYASNGSTLTSPQQSRVMPPRKIAGNGDGAVIAIGISAGGPATLHKIIPQIPKEFPPMLIAQHMPADFTGPFANRLNAASQIEVKEAQPGDALKPGRLLLAPGNRHLTVRRSGVGYVAALDDGPKVSGFRPSADVLLSSVAECFGTRTIGLIMTGMGFDGAEGIRKVHEAGGRTLSQDQESCIVYGMPKAAFETGCVDRVVSLAGIPDALAKAAADAGVPA